MNQSLEHFPKLSLATSERVSLAEICSENNSRNKAGLATEIRSVTNNRGLVVTSEYFENSRTSADTTNYKVVKKNMFAYNPSRINIGSIAWHQEDHDVAVSPMYVVFEINSTRVMPEYLMHFLESPVGKQQIMDKCEVGARFRLPFNSLSKISMNLPSLEVQAEIVQILDQFTQLEVGLESELVARKTQYAFFRKSLLECDPQTSKTYKLEDVCARISSGGTPSRSRADFFGGTIPWVRTQEVDFKEIWSTELNITDLALKNSSANWVPANTVILAMYGATAGKSAITRIPVTTNQACCNLEVDSKLCLPEYLFHWLMANYQEIKSLGQGTQFNLNAGMVRNLEIRLPDLEEQSKVVSALNKFDALTKDMLVGIPAEIQARRHQYEYYRSKLLTFGELETI